MVFFLFLVVEGASVGLVGGGGTLEGVDLGGGGWDSLWGWGGGNPQCPYSLRTRVLVWLVYAPLRHGWLCIGAAVDYMRSSPLVEKREAKVIITSAL